MVEGRGGGGGYERAPGLRALQHHPTQLMLRHENAGGVSNGTTFLIVFSFRRRGRFTCTAMLSLLP